MTNFEEAPSIQKHTCKVAAGAIVALAFACLGLTACGGSSGSSTNAATTSASATSTAGGAATSTAPRSSTQSATHGTQSTTPGIAPPRGGRGFARPGGAGPRTVNPAFRQGLAKFATCLKQNGVDVPNPNASGKGPIFSTKGIDTKSAKFRAATMKCRNILIGAFRRPPGAAPPAAGQSQGSSGSG
jgi:hypothetical protein